MPKNIVILCDGTSNEISQDRTNVLRLYGALAKNARQTVFYDPGVGTFGAANAWSYYYRKAHEVWGLATGWGLDHNVKEAYAFLVDSYDDGKRAGGDDEEPDRIYLFGFSRGAYTARVLAGLIHTVGLIEPINLNLLDYVYRAYKGVSDKGGVDGQDGPRDAKRNPFAEVRLYERILRPRRPVIRCIGVFDTVGSVIEWGRFGPRLRTHAHTKTNRSVEAVRHAVAIDERRTMFQPILWPKGQDYWAKRFRPESATPQDVKEVWFTGVHGDIGGGYPEDRSRLAKIPLHWMIEETRALGLEFKTRTVNEIVLGQREGKHYVPPDPLAARNVSMKGAWPIIELLPRRISRVKESRRRSLLGWYIPFFERRVIPDGAVIHDSVLKRRGTESDFAQPNIPDDLYTKGPMA